MWKWIGNRFKKKSGFTGFKVEIYRDGKLVVVQRGAPNEVLTFNSVVAPMIFDGVRCHGYTLTPHLESN